MHPTRTICPPIGHAIPPGDHSVVVSLPTWKDTLEYKLHDPGTLSQMQNGYPRFFMPRIVCQLCELLEKRVAQASEKSLLVCSDRAADALVAFLAKSGSSSRVVPLCPLDGRPGSSACMVVFPAEHFPVADQFWQHTGLGIQSRVAEKYVALLVRGDESFLASAVNSETSGRPVPLSPCKSKAKIRQRIADLLSHTSEHHIQASPDASLTVHEENVFLYPAGMVAIWSAHQIFMNVFGYRKSVCFGFPYTDTLKILEKWGPGCHFYPESDAASIDELERFLREQRLQRPSEPPILALFTEFPSNPLLRSVNLPRLRKLADEFDFVIAVDDTVGNFVNVDILPFVDVLMSSLTKIFSGAANVMGGSLVLNPAGRCYSTLKAALDSSWEDIYFEEEADIMEANSRDFAERVAKIDHNAEAICDYLRSCDNVVSAIYYPKWQTRESYEMGRSKFVRNGAGFGGLFSLVFVSPRAAQAFFDALDCAKGPSLGTNFTLAGPYTLYAHFTELEWSTRHGVPEDLVRVSVGLEDTDHLLEVFTVAVDAAVKAHGNM